MYYNYLKTKDMKNIVISFFMFFMTFTSFTQVSEVKFDQFIGFSSNSKSTNYFTLMDSNNLVFEFVKVGYNRYIIDFENKTVTLYFQGVFINKCEIMDSRVEGSITFITLIDFDISSGEQISTFLVINEDPKNNSYPYFTYYFDTGEKILGHSADRILE